MSNKGYNIKAAYHRMLEEKGGELPTVREMAAATGAPLKYLRGTLRRARLPYRHIVDNSAACEAHRKKREERDREFREQHESLTRSAGRYPTRAEMNKAMGYAKDSGMSTETAKRLGLELQGMRRRKEPAPEPKTLPPEPAYDFGHRATPSMVRIFEIRQGDALGEGKGWGHIPGEEYAATDRVMITCPVCGAQKLIAPRMHPHWLRNRLGKVVFVDSMACTGRIAY